MSTSTADVVEAARGRWHAYTDEERRVASFVAAFAALVAVLVALGQLRVAFVVSTAALAGMYVLLAFGLNVQWGYAGLVNFSVVAFWGIGAYSAALLTGAGSPHGLELHPLVGVAVAVVLSVVLALAIGLPTLRLRADYLAIATLGFAEIVRLLVLNEGWLTAGGLGVGGIPVLLQPPALEPVATLLGVQPRTIGNLFVISVVALGVFLFLRRIQRSPWGRVLRTIRADEDLAQALGKDTYRFKMVAFVIGSVIMALAGVYYAHMVRFVTPSDLLPIETFYVWIAVILGGTGSNRGAILGGLTIVVIQQGTRIYNDQIDAILFFASVDASALRLFLVGLLVIVVVRLRPEGILPPQREHVWPRALAAHENATSVGDERASNGDDRASVGDDRASSGDDRASSGDEETSNEDDGDEGFQAGTGDREPGRGGDRR